jgi:carboxymethylenebutenolidase
MPIYDPSRVEYMITSSVIQIVLDGGGQLPAYLACPTRGNRFPAIALVHDWWGMTDRIRHLANMFAQCGYYVIVPDLFNGKVAHTPQEAMQLVQYLGGGGYERIHAALTVLEHHHQTNSDVAAIGVGMGGSLAFEAGILRKDLEAVIAFGGFPQRYFGRFGAAPTPIMAVYGTNEPYINGLVIDKLRHELAVNDKNQVMIVDGVGHDFFTEADDDSPQHRANSKLIWSNMMSFLEKYLRPPLRPSVNKTY